MSRAVLVMAALAGLTFPAQAAGTFSGRAQIVDGDTLIVQGQTERVRLFGVDAPEKQQTCRNAYGLRYLCGSRAADALAGIIGRNGVVTCEEQDRDRYGRIVAVCMIGQKDVAGELVRAGWARDYERYSRGRYASQEAEAKSAKRGAWAGRWRAPWEWRKSARHGNGEQSH